MTAIERLERPFRLRALVMLQRRDNHPDAQPGVLGDATLLHRLPLLARLRRAVCMYGYRFVPADQISGRHSLFPLLELTEILGQRVIPIRRTENAALRIIENDPKLSLTPRLFRDICVSNYLSHESAHALFYESAVAICGPLNDASKVEILLASEAFAMAVDQFVALLAAADGRRSTAICLSANAYVVPCDLARNPLIQPTALALAARTADHQPIETISMLAAASMVALARPSAGKGRPGMAALLAEVAGVSGLEPGVLETLLAIGMRVDFDFRSAMQQNFYAYLGLESRYREFIAAPLNAMVRPDNVLGQLVPPLSRQLVGISEAAQCP